MMHTLTGKRLVFLALVLLVFYVGHRMYESRGDAALLREKTLEDAVPTVAIVTPKPGSCGAGA